MTSLLLAALLVLLPLTAFAQQAAPSCEDLRDGYRSGFGNAEREAAQLTAMLRARDAELRDLKAKLAEATKKPEAAKPEAPK